MLSKYSVAINTAREEVAAKELKELETKTRARVEKAKAILAAKPEEKQLQVSLPITAISITHVFEDCSVNILRLITWRLSRLVQNCELEFRTAWQSTATPGY